MTAKLNREQVAWRAAQDIEDGFYVNLGIGMPLGIPKYIPEGREVIFHSENGVLGMGPAPEGGNEDPDYVNAGGRPMTVRPGGALFHHSDSFGMIRGGHIDICFLGAFQVAANGDLANWSIGSKARIPAVGGAMDLAAGAKRIYITMEHCTRDGFPKIVERCALPLTGVGCVKRIFTEYAVIDVSSGKLALTDIVDGVSVDELQAMTGADLNPAPHLRVLTAPDIAAD
jgi:3-oxoadipate CoA-transferase beta subunit